MVQLVVLQYLIPLLQEPVVLEVLWIPPPLVQVHLVGVVEATAQVGVQVGLLTDKELGLLEDGVISIVVQVVVVQVRLAKTSKAMVREVLVVARV